MASPDRRRQLADLERIIVDGVSGMDQEDTIGSVKVHYADGGARWLMDVIEQANEIRAELARRGRP